MRPGAESHQETTSTVLQMKHNPLNCVRCAVSVAGLVGLLAQGAAHAATVYIQSTIVIPAGSTYNGNGNTIVAQGMGDGSQNEGQKPFFRLNSESWLRNVRLAAPGVDGCHFYGNGTMNEVTWQDIGEDQFTVKSGGNCWVSGGAAYAAADKAGQVNAATWITLYYHYQDNVAKNIRQNGGTTYACNFYYDHNTARNTREAIGRTDSSSTRFGVRQMVVQNFSGSRGWWYGRDSQAFNY
jgi:pectate lyase C